MPPLHTPVTDFATSSMNPLAHGGLSSSSHTFRKTVVRKTVDYNSSIINHLKNRLFSQSSSSLYSSNSYLPTRSSQLLSTVDYIPSMTIPFSEFINSNPSHCYATKYISQSQNKSRAVILSCCYTPDDGKRVLTASSTGEFTLWNGLTFNFETLLQSHEYGIRTIRWSNSKIFFISADDGGVIKLWQSSLLNVRAWQAHKTSIRDAAWSPNDSKIVTVSDDQTISIWDVETINEIHSLEGHGNEIKCCSYHPEMSLLITGGKDHLIKLWDPRTGGKELITLTSHKNTINKIEFNKLNNGIYFASGGRDQIVKIWDIRKLNSNQSEIQSFKGHKREILSMCWHTQCERLLTTGSYDGDIKHWLVGSNSDECVASIDGAHEGSVNSINWHPLGHMMVSGSSDYSIRYWARNRPGDEMTDKYNVTQLPEAKKHNAIKELLQVAKLNPNRQGQVRIPHQIEQALQESGMDLDEEIFDRPNANNNNNNNSTRSQIIDNTSAASAAAQRMKQNQRSQIDHQSRDSSPNRNSFSTNQDDDYRRSQQQSRSQNDQQSDYNGPSHLRPRTQTDVIPSPPVFRGVIPSPQFQNPMPQNHHQQQQFNPAMLQHPNHNPNHFPGPSFNQMHQQVPPHHQSNQMPQNHHQQQQFNPAMHQQHLQQPNYEQYR